MEKYQQSFGVLKMSLTAEDLNRALKRIKRELAKPPRFPTITISVSQIPYLLKYAAELKLDTETIEQLKSWAKETEQQK